MALKLSVSVINALLDAIETTVGTAPLLKIRTGSAPATCATADSGSVLATVTLPSDWMAAASSGSKVKAGTWSTTGSATGTAGHFRIYESTGVTCHLQGSCAVGSGELSLTTLSIESGADFTVTTGTLSTGNL